MSLQHSDNRAGVTCKNTSVVYLCFRHRVQLLHHLLNTLTVNMTQRKHQKQAAEPVHCLLYTQHTSNLQVLSRQKPLLTAAAHQATPLPQAARHLTLRFMHLLMPRMLQLLNQAPRVNSQPTQTTRRLLPRLQMRRQVKALQEVTWSTRAWRTPPEQAVLLAKALYWQP